MYALNYIENQTFPRYTSLIINIFRRLSKHSSSSYRLRKMEKSFICINFFISYYNAKITRRSNFIELESKEDRIIDRTLIKHGWKLTSMGYLSGTWVEETVAAVSIVKARIDLKQRLQRCLN